LDIGHPFGWSCTQPNWTRTTTTVVAPRAPRKILDTLKRGSRQLRASMALSRETERPGRFDAGKKSLLSLFKKLYWPQVWRASRNGMGGLRWQSKERWDSPGGNPALFLLCTSGPVPARVGFALMEPVADRPYAPLGAMWLQGCFRSNVPTSGMVERKGGRWRWHKVV
jgi:hypothetical protein